MSRVLTIVKKEFLHIVRDSRTMGLIIALPALLLILLGFGVSGESSDIPLAIADLSVTDSSRSFIDNFTVTGDFMWSDSARSEDELLNLIDRDKVKAGLLIPEDFSRNLASGEKAEVIFYVNGSADVEMVQTIQLKMNAISQMAAQNILVTQIQRMGSGINLQVPVESHLQVLYNPEGDNGLYMIPGLIPIILQLQALLLSALAIVREREQGTMEQLIVTPIRSWELVMGKIIPYLIVTIFNTLALVLLGWLIFGVTISGSFWELMASSIIFIIGTLGMGVLISNISQTQMQAVYMAVFIVIIPAIILSGLLFSRDNMPAVTYWFSEIMPVTHYLNITRGIFLKGVSWLYLLRSNLMLIILSFVYFIASVVTFRKRI